jgi:hypothetical protein
VYKSLIDSTVVFVPHNQSAKLTDPGNRSFDNPSARVSTHPSAILARWAFAILSMWGNEQKVFLCQFISEYITVISLIRDQWCWNFWITGLIYGFRCGFDLSPFGRMRGACQRYSLAISHHRRLCILSTLGFSNVFAPFFAGAKLPSMKSSSQLIRPFSFNSSMKACHISRNTPASSHSTNLLQQVLGKGNLSGRSFQRAILLRTHKIPSKQLQSSALGRPPLECSTFGMKRLTFSHCSSVSKTSRRPDIDGLLSISGVTYQEN